MQSAGYWILRRIFKYGSLLVKPFERKCIRKYGKQDPGRGPVFIVGLPRSGSTFLYQVLTDMFDVIYIDNLMTLGREILYLSSRLSHFLYQDKPHYNYVSSFGDTLEGGLHAPSEAGSLWYRWIPENRIYVDESSLSQDQKNRMILNIHALMNRYRKTLVIKNLFFSTRIRLIRSLFPEAKFLVIHREPVYIAQSIYLSRIRNCRNPEREWWSVRFPGYESVLGRPLEEQVARQVYELDKILRRDLAGVDPENVMEVEYGQLDLEILEHRFRSLAGADRRKLFRSDQITFIAGNKKKVDDAIFERFQDELDKCYSDHETFEIDE